MSQWFLEKFKLCKSKIRKRNDDDDPLSWDVGLKPHAFGEYSVAVVQANSILEDQCHVIASPSQTLVGLYDGHGGPDASRFVQNHLVSHINQFGAEDGRMTEEVIRKAFNATEEGFAEMVMRVMKKRPQIATAGTCCLFGVIVDKLLYLANLGDSRVVLGRRDDVGCSNVVAERLTTDHNVGVEEVREEVKALHPDDPHIVLNCNGVWRVKGIIQVSRAIGDLYLKKLEMQPYYPISLKRAVISAEPSITTKKLMPEDLFLIFASDGLWEQLTDEEAVNIVARNPRAGVAKRLIKAALTKTAKTNGMTFAEVLDIPNGSRRQVHDDITVIVIYLDQNDSSSTNKPKHSDFSTHSTATPIDIFSSNTSITEEPDDNPI